MRKISQRQARAFKRRVSDLESQLAQQRKAYASEWPSSVVIYRSEPHQQMLAVIETARKLGHAVVVVPQGKELAYFASNLGRE